MTTANESKVTTLEDQAPAEPKKPKIKSAAKNHDDELSGDKVTVTFFEQEGDLGKDAIFASLNGYAYNIPRGEPVEIPVELLAIFENSRFELVETVKGGGSRTRSVNRFAYQVNR